VTSRSPDQSCDHGAMTTVVLVAGAWHGAWCWDRVLARLLAFGVSARTVELPGRGVDPGTPTDLPGDVERVREVLSAVTGPILLVGHSYGGAVITEAGAHPAVTELVFLAGFPLTESESVQSAASDEAGRIDHSGRPKLRFTASEEGILIADAAASIAVFYADCDPETQRWASTRLGPQLKASLSQSPRVVAWRDRPSTYAVCTQDNAVHPDLQRILARRCTRFVEWASGHSPFLSHPDWVADLLAERAAAQSDVHP
jgi:pimeloyl-ACP methyl ester carboxylesterase